MKIAAIASIGGFLFAISVLNPTQLMAQASAGPMAPPQSQSTSARPVTAKAKPPVVRTRTTLDGAWKLNHDESDDPRSKAQIKDRGRNGGNGGTYPGGGNPGGGYPGGPMGGGYPFPGSGGGGQPRNRAPNEQQQTDQKLLDLIRPASTLSFIAKSPEFDVTDDQFHKLVFFTDGRQLQKPKDDTYQEIAAKWDGAKLESDEKSPQGAKMIRTFELAQNGQQLYETIHIDAVKNKSAVYVQYVYDIPPPEPTHQTDPDQPIMKRRADNSDTANQQGSQSSGPSDPDQPVMKRKSDDSDSSTASQQTTQTMPTQSTQPSAPDPDQPVMKRRAGSSSQ